MGWTILDAFLRSDGEVGHLKAHVMTKRGTTEWTPLGRDAKLQLLGTASRAAVCLAHSSVHPSDPKTVIAHGLPVIINPSDNSDIFFCRRDQVGWYQVHVTDLVGGTLLVLLSDVPSYGNTDIEIAGPDLDNRPPDDEG